MDSFKILEIVEKLAPIFKEMKNTKAWNDMFVSIGDGILNLEHDKGELFEQLCILFSEENLESIAKENKSSSYLLIEKIEKQLAEFFSKNDLYSIDRQRYIDMFINVFRKKLEENFPEEYDRVFLNDFRSENKQEHGELYKEVNKLANKIDELRTYGYRIKTCDDLNEWYVTNTKNGCTLELFNHENKEFVNKILSQLDKKVINIKGENVFETVAYIAYIFSNDKRFYEYKDKLIIVEDEETWQSISKKDYINYIFINRFYNNDNLSIIENNKCFFVYGKNDYIKSKQFIELDKRFFRNLIEKVNQCGFNNQEAYTISKYSRNNYTILLRKLLLGKQMEPSWANPKNYETLLPAMIINQWLDKDHVFFELLFDNNLKYNDYLKKLNEINDPQDPFYVKFNTWYNDYRYLISDAEDTWDYFADYIDDSLFEKIEPLIDLIFDEIDPKFNLPVEKHYYARVLGYRQQYSDELRIGFIETLIYLSRPESKINHFIQEKIKNVINKVDTHKEWLAISEVLPLIYEINPDAVISKFELELEKENSGLINLFIEKSDDFISGRNYYTHVLWTLEKALYDKDYVYRAIIILSKLMDLDIEYSLSNSPMNTLYNALVAWNHEYIYTIDEKVEFVRYIVENRNKGWHLLNKLLPSNNSEVISSLCKPKFSTFLLCNELQNRNQIYETYLKYYEIAFNNINGSVDNLYYIFKNTLFFDFGKFEELKAITHKLLNELADKDKYKLYKEVYRLISRHRHFLGSEWACNKEYLDKLEKEILDEIIFQDESYKYQYVFESYDNILLNPVVFEKNDDHDSIRKNQNLEDELRRYSIKRLVALNIDWCDFISRFDEKAPNIIGVYLAEEKSDIDFIENISICLINVEKSTILSAYYGSLYSKFGLDIVELVINSTKLDNKQYIKLMFSNITIDNTTAEYLDNIEDEYKIIFWKNENFIYRVNEDVKDFALNNYINYKNASALIELADRYNYPTDKLIKVLEVIRESDMVHHQITSYHIERIFRRIYEDDFPKEDISQNVMNLEVYFLPILSNKNELRYLRYNLSKNPKLATELIKYSYKRESDNNVNLLDENDKKLAEISHTILFSIKFSPTNDGSGPIEYNLLKDWCNEYINAVTINNQKKIGLQYLGRFLANTNIINEGEFPQKSVKQVIEDIFDEELLIGFAIEISNRIGVRTISDGSDYLALANKYENYANNSKMYPKTYKILKNISDSFYRDYESEKASAEYDD